MRPTLRLLVIPLLLAASVPATGAGQGDPLRGPAVHVAQGKTKLAPVRPRMCLVRRCVAHGMADSDWKGSPSVGSTPMTCLRYAYRLEPCAKAPKGK